MSKTISFVASDELAAYLEREAEKRMTTVSSTAQMLLAEYARMQKDFREEKHGMVPSPDTIDERIEELDAAIQEDRPARFSEPEVFEKHPDAWYEPDSEKYEYAVKVPADSGTTDAGKRRYLKTENGAAEALTRWYE